MADEQYTSRAQDGECVDVEQVCEPRSKALNVTAEQLKAAIKVIDSHVAAVQAHLRNTRQ